MFVINQKKSKMKLLSITALLSLLLFSCGSDKEELSVNFKLNHDSEPLVMFEEYEFGEAGGTPFEVTRFSFYISNVNLIIDGESQRFVDVDFIDLSESHSSLERANEGFDYVLGETEGDASSISFNLGLTPEQNATVPTDYPSSNVLSKTGEYWPGWESYVFVKIEGNIDVDRDGTKEQGFALHLGSDDVLRSTSGDYSDDLTITFDLKDIFSCNGELYDLESMPMIRSLAQLGEAMSLADNFACGTSYDN